MWTHYCFYPSLIVLVDKSCLYATWEQVLLWWTPVVFVCLEHSLSLGNDPSSSHDTQVELSIPEPPDAQGAVATGMAHYSGLVSHKTSKLIGCAKPFSPFLGFAIQTPEESRFLSLSLSAIRRWTWDFPVSWRKLVCRRKSGNSPRRNRSQQSQVLEWENEQISWLFEMNWYNPLDLARTEDRTTFGLLNKFSFGLTFWVSRALT